MKTIQFYGVQIGSYIAADVWNALLSWHIQRTAATSIVS
ncbi:hypothetical protein NK6_2460 [Bradyrhizobium diazoefficiens]|uniref:Uncharacterized protein n=1 Tax=Bradyrhizobium diazoefficiens TaxID=1355477 RepID=A0A0E4FSM5_9BRAD|nr:hypothetical protein NK6_2460 [Bradyrhizobium diazoefficiens]